MSDQASGGASGELSGDGAGSVGVTRVESPTELRNPSTTEIDTLPTLEVLKLINAEDARVPVAVESVLPRLAAAVDLAVRALRDGHRVHYFGAGTSGRLGFLDAAELEPTFTLEPDLVVAHHAGGMDALVGAVEDVEDDEDAGWREAAGLEAGDVAVGLTASGRTPYVVGALRRAKLTGVATVLVSANPSATFGSEVDEHVAPDTGPEAIAGSTRMKAGTAQKLVLNAFSTAVMVKLGRTYSNLMISVNAMNAKLRGRVVAILEEATGLDQETCANALARAGGDTRTALVCLLSGVSVGRAAEAVTAADGRVREALRLVDRPESS